MNMTIDIEGNELVINRLVALLKSIPNIKIQLRKTPLIPNTETKKAIEDAKTGNDCKMYNNSTEMFQSFGVAC